MRKHRDLEERADEEAAKVKKREDVEERGLGLSSADDPIKLDIAKATVRKELGIDAASAVPGVSSYWNDFRDKRAKSCFITDAGKRRLMIGSSILNSLYSMKI